MAGRGAGRELIERIAARTSRATRTPLIFKSGQLKSYDATTGLVVVTDYSGDTPIDLGPMQYFHEWSGVGYGDEIGLEKGMHIGLLCVDREGHDWIAIGTTFDQTYTTLGVNPGERYIIDKFGNFIKWMMDSTLRLFGATTAILYGGTNTVLGATSTDATNDAVIRKSDLDQALSDQIAQLKSDLTSWASSSLQGGAGALGPDLTPVTSTGSSKVTAAP